MTDLSAYDNALSKAKVRFLTRKDSIFLSTVCSSLETRWDSNTPFGATDGKCLYLNPQAFLALSPDEQVFLLAHETLHVAYMHMIRVGDRDKHLFNIAADYVINDELIHQGFKMIEGGLHDTQYHGMSAEEVYDLLDKNNQTPSNSLGDDIIMNADLSDADIQQIQSKLISASIMAEQSNQIGSIPAPIKRQLDKLLKPKINWKVVLRRFFHDLDNQDYTWRKPKKRYLPMYLPSRESKQLSKISIAIDTSGSISQHDFTQFISEVAAVFRFLKPKEIEVIQFDWGIRSIDNVKNLAGLQYIDFIGGGGTDVSQVIHHVMDKPARALVIITDGELDTNLPKPSTPVIWAVFDNPTFQAPFGQCIYFEK